MRLYVYDHCPFCVRVRVAASLLNHPLELEYLANDDEETPISLVGEKKVPIIEYKENTYMAESMDIVQFLDRVSGAFRFTESLRYPNSQRIKEILQDIMGPMWRLCFPRWPKMALPEFGTYQAKLYFTQKKEGMIGPFEEHIQETEAYIKELQAPLTELGELLDTPGLEHFNLDDLEVFSWLRGLTVIGLHNFPEALRQYMRVCSGITGIDLYDEVKL